MKKLYRLSLAGLSILFLLSNTKVLAEKVLQKGYYLVVAAYSANQEDFASKFSSELNKEGMTADYGFDEKRKFFYVYLNVYASFETSIDEMMKVRTQGKFEKAWVRVIRENFQTVTTQEEPAKSKPKEIVVLPEKTQESISKPIEKPEHQDVIVEKREEPKKDTTKVIDNPPSKPVYVPQTLKSTPVFLSIFNATNNEVLEGDVEVVDAENAQLIKKIKGNDYVNLPKPANKSGELLLITNVFGFRKEEHQINYINTEADTLKPYVSLIGNYYMINFGLSKIHKGDISTLYNVYFYNDAAIMLPTSLYQLNSLMDLLTENPTYKIVLHGHTNGGGSGKIIYMGPSKNFFAMTADVKNGSGSAKELSMARAEVIKEWLISQGIAENRIGVKGWGGSRMIHEKNSVHARKNIRVDVEVVDE